MIYQIANFILGVHPNNTVFCFNWHNVRHINNFFKRAAEGLTGRGHIIADIRGGKSPYFFHSADKCGDFIVIDVEESLPKDEKRPVRQLAGVAELIPLDDNSVDIVLCNQVL